MENPYRMVDGKVLLGRKHTFLSNGDDVLAAGELKIRGGNVVGVNNASGHYQPNVAESNGFLNTLKELGVDVSKSHLSILDASGTVIKHVKPK
ncbi:hypothetical protein ACR78F_03950 [Sphingobacterium spiritivorum]|uniref:hypothetical protein n=1 Tax=Sphingobacterium spiritivorum TaxID=258 RepID=UPI003DA2AD37